MSNSSRALSSFKPPRHTNLGCSAMMSTLTVGLTLVPALVIGWPSTSTFPWAIQDWTTVRLCSGWRSMVSSSKRRLAPGFGARGEEEDVEAWRSPSAVARRAGRMETPGRARDGRDAAALRDDDAAEVSRASDAACMALVFTGTRPRA